MKWLPIDRDENGLATDECLDRMQRTVPFVAATQVQHQFVYHLIKGERDFIVYKEIIYSGRDVTHYLPIPKLEV